MDKFEYEYVELARCAPPGRRDTFGGFLEELTRRGEAGWKLCGFEYGMAFFCRKKDG